MKKKPKFKFFLTQVLIASMIFIFLTCKKRKKNEDFYQKSVSNATVAGRVHSPNNKPIGSAEIKAGIYSTLSDKNGNFVLKVTAGNYKLVIQTGQGHVFKTEINISLAENQVLNLEESQTALKQT